jgi:hypothetical protein
MFIFAFSGFVLHAVFTAPRTAAVTARWFMVFLHIELLLYIALIIIKLPLLCTIKNHFLQLMKEDCNVLRFMFLERGVVRVCVGSLACWVFSSYAYLLAWGDPVVYDPTLQADPGAVNQSEIRLQAFREGRVPTAAITAASPATRVYPDDPYRRASFGGSAAVPDRYSHVVSGGPDRYSHVVSAGPDRYSHIVGDPVSVSTKYEPRYVDASGKSFAGGGSSFHVGGSFQATSGRYAVAPSQYNVMPRNTSSIQSQQSEVSQHAAERQQLIRPPVVIH